MYRSSLIILHKGWEGPAEMMPVATEDVCVMDLPIRGTR